MLLLQTVPSQKFGKLFIEIAYYIILPNQKLSDHCFEKLSRLRNLNVDVTEKKKMIVYNISNQNIKLSAHFPSERLLLK